MAKRKWRGRVGRTNRVSRETYTMGTRGRVDAWTRGREDP